MTEIELNGQLANLSVSLSKDPSQAACGQRRSGRRYRRRKRIEKSDRLLGIVQLPGYAPHRGYVDPGFEGRTLLHTGKYIKYSKNSSCQRRIKRTTSKKVRTYPNLPTKGNHYRRLFDYWWTLY